MHKIGESQKLSVGDRSHPRIIELDALRMHLTYDGWEKDCSDVEKEHLSSIDKWKFTVAIEGIKRKQAIYIGDRSHEHLQCLDLLNLHIQLGRKTLKMP